MHFSHAGGPAGGGGQAYRRRLSGKCGETNAAIVSTPPRLLKGAYTVTEEGKSFVRVLRHQRKG